MSVACDQINKRYESTSDLLGHKMDTLTETERLIEYCFVLNGNEFHYLAFLFMCATFSTKRRTKMGHFFERPLVSSI